MKKPTVHFCKWCNDSFKIKLHEKETGDFFLLCPFCNHKHYRYFDGGEAVHADINNRHYKHQPFTIQGYI